MDSIGFSVSSWSGWTVTANSQSRVPGNDSNIHISDVPDASSVPPLLRRRLNFMGRSCVSEMLLHLKEQENVPIVFCSRHGDIERTLKVLIESARGEPASPMDFSLAVHNAIAGVLSIHRGITANISSIAALQGAVIPVLLEAVGLLSEEHSRVLCIVCDTALPEIYRTPQDARDEPFVACFTVAREGSGRLDVQLRCDPTEMPPDSTRDNPLDFIEFLGSDRDRFTMVHNSSRWTISKQRHQ